MAIENNILGIDSLQIGIAQDTSTVVTDNLQTFADIELNSISFEGETAPMESLASENNDHYLTFDGAMTPAVLKMRLFGVALSEYPMFMGGVFTGDTYYAPAQKEGQYLCLVLTSKPNNGFQRALTIPYAHTSARLQGNITKNGVPALDITFTALIHPAGTTPYTVSHTSV